MDVSHESTGIVDRKWFKPIVAAWFALLLGGGLWLMPPSVHAMITRGTGLDGLHSMFAPPVSAGGSAIVSAIIALFGALLGFAIAGRIAAAAAPRAFAPGFEIHGESSWQDEAEAQAEESEQPRRRRVFSAREDIGEEGIAISAPIDEEAYENEYSVEDIPPATPEEDFEAVYAAMEKDSHAIEEEAVDAELPEHHYEYADDEAQDAEFEPLPEADLQEIAEANDALHHEDFERKQTDEQAGALSDMSLEALLGRLEGALEQHKSMVADSEEAARQPAPQPIPMRPESQSEGEDESLPEAADNDPVIAFLRREASRRMPHVPGDPGDDEDDDFENPRTAQSDAQAALRSALDKLGQVNHRD